MLLLLNLIIKYFYVFIYNYLFLFFILFVRFNIIFFNTLIPDEDSFKFKPIG